ncbi:UNVERIFIED_CONTAM: hypothetical protein HHA_449960 [Hammondia hammondi]|eukprot:XP_008882637.1 hypothetical protein HHA_449960 [Hammondia hammondi]
MNGKFQPGKGAIFCTGMEKLVTCKEFWFLMRSDTVVLKAKSPSAKMLVLPRSNAERGVPINSVVMPMVKRLRFGTQRPQIK